MDQPTAPRGVERILDAATGLPAAVALALAAAALLASCASVRGLVCGAPEPCIVEPPVRELVGIDPATMACRRFDPAIGERGEFIGPFLPVSRCAGKPRPVVLPDDDSG